MKNFCCGFITLVALLSITVSAIDDAAPKPSGKADEKQFGIIPGGGWGLGGLGGWSTFLGGAGLNFMGLPWLPAMPFLGNIYAYGTFVGGFPGLLFKEVDEHNNDRRSLTLDGASELHRRASGTVTCKSNKGGVSEFLASHCYQAANKLATRKASSAQCGTCALSLVNQKGRVAVRNIPVSQLNHAVGNLLKSCTQNVVEEAGLGERSAHKPKGKVSFVMVLGKGDGQRC